MAMAGAEVPYDPGEPSPWWLKGLATVSYTHLTLPTICSV